MRQRPSEHRSRHGRDECRASADRTEQVRPGTGRPVLPRQVRRGAGPGRARDRRRARVGRVRSSIRRRRGGGRAGGPLAVGLDGKQLRSQRLREVNFQGDALRLGMNWTEEDLGKAQVLVDSAYGMGHPGTFHFRELIEEVSNGVYEAGGKPGVFTVSDICDGVVQVTNGMSYSLVSRDIMAAMVEIHDLGDPHDAMVLISGNDKSVPAHLVAIARCDLPAIHLPGGTQLNSPDSLTSDLMWPIGADVERGVVPREDLEVAQRG